MENLPTISDFATLKWPPATITFGPTLTDKSAYPVAAKPVVVMGECGTGKTPSGDLCVSACRQKLKSAIYHGRELGQRTGRSGATHLHFYDVRPLNRKPI